MADTMDSATNSTENTTKDLANYLEKLGLDSHEISIYLTLLTQPDISILELSRSVNIPRTSVYRTLNQLVSKKFATWEIEENRRTIKVAQQEDRLKETKQSIEDLSTMVSKLVSLVPQTEVRYYKGKKGMQQLIWNTLKAKTDIVGYSQFGRVDIVGTKFYDSYVREFTKLKLTDRAISNETSIPYIKKHVITPDTHSKHQLDDIGIRIIPEEIYYVSGDHSLYDNIYSISYWEGDEIVGIEIENTELVKMHRSIFEFLWKMAKPVSEVIG